MDKVTEIGTEYPHIGKYHSQVSGEVLATSLCFSMAGYRGDRTIRVSVYPATKGCSLSLSLSLSLLPSPHVPLGTPVLFFFSFLCNASHHPPGESLQLIIAQLWLML